MKIAKKLRWVLAGGIVLVTFFFLLFLFFATQSFLNLWDRLQQAPEWLFYTYMGLVALVILASGYFIYRLLYGDGKQSISAKEPVNEGQLRAEIDQYSESGIDTLPLQNELARLQQRKESGQINICLLYTSPSPRDS